EFDASPQPPPLAWRRRCARARSFLELPGKRDELIELAFRRAAVDALQSPLHTRLVRLGDARGVDRGTRIERHDVARRPRRIAEHGKDHVARLLDRADLDRPAVEELEAEIGWMDVVFADLAVDQLADHGRSRGRDLVEAVEAVNHHDVARAEPLE